MSGGERRELPALVRPHIRWRFELDAENFAARLQELLAAEAAETPGPQSPRPHFRNA